MNIQLFLHVISFLSIFPWVDSNVFFSSSIFWYLTRSLVMIYDDL